MKYYVYVLQSLKSGKFYIGYTGDLEKRLARHNSGGSVYTKNRGPFNLVYYEVYNDRKTAMARENKIKSYKGGDSLKHLINCGGGGVANRIRL